MRRMKKIGRIFCDGQWALHGIGILAARRPVNSVDRTLDVGAFVRCAYRASAGDTRYQSETQHKPRNGVGSIGTSELYRRHRPRGTARADGKRSAGRGKLCANVERSGLGGARILVSGSSDQRYTVSATSPTKKARRLGDTRLWQSPVTSMAECHKRQWRTGRVFAG